MSLSGGILNGLPAGIVSSGTDEHVFTSMHTGQIITNSQGNF